MKKQKAAKAMPAKPKKNYTKHTANYSAKATDSEMQNIVRGHK